MGDGLPSKTGWQMDELITADAATWREWLVRNEGTSDGVWLVLAKKGTVTPTSLGYDDALDEALCSGWIDGQRRGRDETTFSQRFTPRRARSIWSLRNVGLVDELTAGERMRHRGEAEVAKARADGRWDRAYAGASTVAVPDDLAAALRLDPAADARFAELGGGERYAILHAVITAPNAEVRSNRIARQIELLLARATRATRESP